MRRWKLFLLLLVLQAVVAQAENRYQLVRIQAHGSKRHSEADIIRASGLVQGTQIPINELNDAAQRLNSTGAFATVRYGYRAAANPGGIEASFEVQDAEHYLPVIFDNFVWFTPQDLQNIVHSSVPLFDGAVPTSGNMPDLVVVALNKLLDSKNLPSEISYELRAVVGKEADAFIFKIANAQVPIRAVTFPTVTRLEPKLLQQSLLSLIGGDYAQTRVETVAKLNVLPLYRQQGYLKAAIESVKPHVNENGGVEVEMLVTEGGQYSLAGYSWSGNTLISSDELSKMISAKTGRLMNEVQLKKELAQARKAFGKFGREGATVTPVPSFTNNTVSYVIEVKEGELYHMGKLEVVASESQRERILAAWKLASGAPYDSTYIRQIGSRLSVLFPGTEWKAFEQIDDGEKVVNVRLQFF